MWEISSQDADDGFWGFLWNFLKFVTFWLHGNKILCAFSFLKYRNKETFLILYILWKTDILGLTSDLQGCVSQLYIVLEILFVAEELLQTCSNFWVLTSQSGYNDSGQVWCKELNTLSKLQLRFFFDGDTKTRSDKSFWLLQSCDVYKGQLFQS